ncbi:DUF4407 domain-containing protein [Rhodococcus qingshengii]|nr:DUF4407 domain-containing protein [Rhodococcus qingshengii]
MTKKYYLARLAGSRVDVLAKLPGSVAKQTAMGSVLLTTAGFAAISAAYALSITGIATGWAAIAGGVVWGLAILNLDRLLVIGLSHEKRIGRSLMLAIPRVVLAIVIGFVISTPLMLKVFESEIETQLNRNILASQEELRTDLKDSTLSSDLADAEAQLARMRALINAGPTADPAANPEVGLVQAEIDKLGATASKQKADADSARTRALAEEEGSAGTGVPGCAALCLEKKRLAEDAERLWQDTLEQMKVKEGEKASIIERLKTTLLEESTKAVADAEKDLPTAEQSVETLRSQVDSAQNGSYALEQANKGIIARLKALNDLSGSDGTASMAHLAVSILFMLVELLPVLFKVISNAGTRTPYDELVEAFEEEEKRDATEDIDTRKRVAEFRRDAEFEAEQDRINKQQETVLKVNETVVAHQTEVVDDALEQWSRHAKRVSAERLREWERELVGGPPVRPDGHSGAESDQSNSRIETSQPAAEQTATMWPLAATGPVVLDKPHASSSIGTASRVGGSYPQSPAPGGVSAGPLPHWMSDTTWANGPAAHLQPPESMQQ